jgi:hypothetical protein
MLDHVSLGVSEIGAADASMMPRCVRSGWCASSISGEATGEGATNVACTDPVGDLDLFCLSGLRCRRAMKESKFS